MSGGGQAGRVCQQDLYFLLNRSRFSDISMYNIIGDDLNEITANEKK